MNSSFYLSGVLAFSMYVLLFGLLLGYFHFHAASKTVGKKDAIAIDLQVMSAPKEHPEPKKDNTPKSKPAPAKKKQDTQPKAKSSQSLQQMFSSIATKKKTTQNAEQSSYKSTYRQQEFEQREPADVNIDSIKNVTITQQQTGQVQDEAIMAFQRFVASKWDPGVGSAHSAKVDVTVHTDGRLVYRVIHYSSSGAFNREVDAFIKNVSHYKPVDERMRIELVLSTKT